VRAIQLGAYVATQVGESVSGRAFNDDIHVYVSTYTKAIHSVLNVGFLVLQ